jgi:hypothetical protein
MKLPAIRNERKQRIEQGQRKLRNDERNRGSGMYVSKEGVPGFSLNFKYRHG